MENVVRNTNIGELISNERGFNSRKKLAADAGIQYDRLGRIENGETDPTPDEIKKLAKALGVDIEYLIGAVNKKDMFDEKIEDFIYFFSRVTTARQLLKKREMVFEPEDFIFHIDSECLVLYTDKESLLYAFAKLDEKSSEWSLKEKQIFIKNAFIEYNKISNAKNATKKKIPTERFFLISGEEMNRIIDKEVESRIRSQEAIKGVFD